jgi:hypothetical protein
MFMFDLLSEGIKASRVPSRERMEMRENEFLRHEIEGPDERPGRPNPSGVAYSRQGVYVRARSETVISRAWAF